MQPFFAMITPLGGFGGGIPTHPIYYPPSIWPSPGHPAHPIAPGGPVPPVDPGYGYPQYPVDPGYGIPGPPYPGIWPSPGHPAHPIVIPPLPPSIWPSPGHPAHPIVLPPDAPVPPEVGIWPDPGPLPGVGHPIVIPSEKYGIIVWIPGVGYKVIVIEGPLPPGYNPPSGGAAPQPVK